MADRQAAIAEPNRMQPGALAATRHLSISAQMNMHSWRYVARASRGAHCFV
jgi:hypothetical protein